MNNNLPLEEILNGGSTAFFSQNDFLTRQRNNFDAGITNVIYGVTDIDSVIKKTDDVFGNAERELKDGYIIIKPKDLFEKTRFTFGDLVEIIYRLRDPDGCPWDRAQTNASIRGNIIEEAYELVEAIDLNDESKMREECGDVVLQGVLSAAIADSDGRFSVNDIITDLCVKLIGRHTHIFGKDKATNAEDALYFWEKAKAKEKHYGSVIDKIDSIPLTFNALMKANKAQKIIKKTGFDFADTDGAIDKLYEEIDEFKKAEAENKESEAGDILFAAVNVLRMEHIDPEVALTGTTNRFIKRFEHIVKRAEEQGKRVEELSLDEMETFYQEAKKHE